MIKNEFMKIYYDQDDNIVFLELQKKCGTERYKSAFSTIIELFMDNSAETFIISFRFGLFHSKSEFEWLYEKFIPALLHTSCNNIHFIVPNGSDNLNEIQQHERRLNKYFNVKIIHE